MFDNKEDMYEKGDIVFLSEDGLRSCIILGEKGMKYLLKVHPSITPETPMLLLSPMAVVNHESVTTVDIYALVGESTIRFTLKPVYPVTIPAAIRLHKPAKHNKALPTPIDFRTT
jgi:hypothetical protein